MGVWGYGHVGGYSHSSAEPVAPQTVEGEDHLNTPEEGAVEREKEAKDGREGGRGHRRERKVESTGERQRVNKRGRRRVEEIKC